jgi:hypothetical protein
MAKLTDDELATIGREWLRVVALAKQEDIVVEHDHVRFRDSDLSIKGGALLGFGGLMLAADLVFLSASADSFIGMNKPCGYVGFAGLFLLMAGAFCAVLSIMLSRKGAYNTAWSSFGLMKLYHDQRRRWLDASACLIAAAPSSTSRPWSVRFVSADAYGAKSNLVTRLHPQLKAEGAFFVARPGCEGV